MIKFTMIRKIIIGLMAFSFCLTAPVAWAAQVVVRGGEHDEYSRLVFDWPSQVQYTIERAQDNELVITFKIASSLDQSDAVAKNLANIKSIKVLSEDPLSVSLSIPEQSKIRDLLAGSRVVVDVYNPPGQKKKVEAPAPSPPPEPAAEEKTAQVEAPIASVTEEVQEEAKTEESKEALEEVPAAVAAEAEAEEKPEEEAQPEKPKVVQLQAKSNPNIITISSTDPYGIAAFEISGRLWIVNDKNDIIVNPQIAGPDAESLEPLTEIDTSQGKAFVTAIPKGTKISGQGGGVLWRILLASDLDLQEPVDFVRSGVKQNIARSGKILWPLKGARSVIDAIDPLTGQNIKVVTVEEANQFAGPAREFVDFEVLPSPIGLAVAPKIEDLQVKIVPDGVEISRAGELTMVTNDVVNVAEERSSSSKRPKRPVQRIFDFQTWQLGGESALDENRTIILGQLKDQSDSTRVSNLLTLAKMYVANSMGPEALGILDFVEEELPALEESPEFLALRGVASAISRHNEDAFEDLSIEKLAPFEEVNYWRAYVLADEGDWQQASDLLPEDVDILQDYPAALVNRLVPVLVEVALRAGKLDEARDLLDVVELHQDVMAPPQQAALEYLKGEAARQTGDVEGTKKHWEPLTQGPDDLYRAKAGLAMTRLQVEQGEMTPKESIDNLERLRYAWRGDELEAQIYYWLGRTYFELDEYLKGLRILREAAGFVPGTDFGHRIAGEMVDIYTGLFLNGGLEKVNPLDAVALYDQFKELIPLDDRSNKIVEKLAEHLVKADLLTRAADLLTYQLAHRLQGEEAFRVGMRVTAIRLLEQNPQKALEVLKIAEDKLAGLPEAARTPKRYRDVALLRARALSRQGRPDQALELLASLGSLPDVNRLRADIAWTAGYWDAAAQALEDVVLDQNISLTRPLESNNADLLLRRAIALNLSNDRIALANMREKYSDLMNQTDKAKTFEVITRARQSSALADRETLMGIVAEVDLFEDFLNAFKAETPAESDAAAPSTTTTVAEPASGEPPASN